MIFFQVIKYLVDNMTHVYNYTCMYIIMYMSL